jgi:hypothetical protein
MLYLELSGIAQSCFMLFVPFRILLATAVGPSTSIAMQPRLVNFTVPDSFVSFNASTDDLYPISLAEPGAPLSDATNHEEVGELDISPPKAL